MIERHDDYINEDDDDLSLCDLPIYSSSGSNSFSSLNQYEYREEANHVFEFFSAELDSIDHSAFQENDDIIFCGKLICRKNVTDQKSSTTKAKKQGVLFSWKRLKIASFSFRKSKSKTKLLPKTESDSSVKVSSSKKVSTLLNSQTKSRWNLFMFGQTRFPQAMTMDLSDLKIRQQRRLCSSSTSMNHRTTEGGGSGDGVNKGCGSGRGRRGIWSLLKESVTTSVAKTNANDVVRAVGSISLL